MALVFAAALHPAVLSNIEMPCLMTKPVICMWRLL